MPPRFSPPLSPPEFMLCISVFKKKTQNHQNERQNITKHNKTEQKVLTHEKYRVYFRLPS